MIEYSNDNRFPFRCGQDANSVIQVDDHEDLYELGFIYDKITQKYPKLKAEEFYGKLRTIQDIGSDDSKNTILKSECDKLLRNIQICLQDEAFIHQIHRNWGFGVGKVIRTLYAVYGYYFYTGKRTANVIKKTLDGYKTRPIQ